MYLLIALLLQIKHCRCSLFRLTFTVSLIKTIIRHIIRNERNAYLECTMNLFLTNADKTKFENVYGYRKNNFVIGCFEKFEDKPIIKANDFNAKNIVLAITGSLDSYQSEDSILYFLSDLYPCIQNNFANIELIISGKNPSNKIISGCKRYSNIRLIANPENISEIIKLADIFVCPTRLGGGLKLDGTDDYVEVEGWPGICGKKPRAVFAWLKTQGIPVDRLPIITWGRKQQGAYWLLEVDEDQRLRLSCGTGFISANEQQVGDGNWHHVAVVLDPVEPERPLMSDVLLYVDGKRRTIYKMEEAEINTGCIENVRIGGAHGPDDNTFAGTIDEVAIFDVVVGPTAVQQAYMQ